jgi:hypothetical protein
MWLIGTFIYRGHHWMNTRDEVLSGVLSQRIFAFLSLSAPVDHFSH